MASSLPDASERRQIPGVRLHRWTWLLVGVAALIWAGAELGSAAARPTVDRYEWRRMASGWERVATWRPPEPVEPAVHPLLLASLELIASLVALSAAAPE
jgi:hypothetical protein